MSFFLQISIAPPLCVRHCCGGFGHIDYRACQEVISALSLTKGEHSKGVVEPGRDGYVSGRSGGPCWKSEFEQKPRGEGVH